MKLSSTVPPLTLTSDSQTAGLHIFSNAVAAQFVGGQDTDKVKRIERIILPVIVNTTVQNFYVLNNTKISKAKNIINKKRNMERSIEA